MKKQVINEFIHEQLPDINGFINTWQQQIAEGPEVVYIEDAAPAVIGHAIETDIGLDLTGQLPYPEYIRCLSPACCRFILLATGLAGPEIATKTEPLHQTLTQAIRQGTIEGKQIDSRGVRYEMTAYNDITQYLHLQGEEEMVKRHLYWQASEGHRQRTPDMLITAWREYLKRGREQLVDLGEPTYVAPAIIPDYANADLIKGETLVEIKAMKDPGKRDAVNKMFHQVLAYALLDQADVFGIRSIGVYNVFQGLLVSDKLETILSTSSRGATPALSDLRQDLAARLTY